MAVLLHQEGGQAGPLGGTSSTCLVVSHKGINVLLDVSKAVAQPDRLWIARVGQRVMIAARQIQLSRDARQFLDWVASLIRRALISIHTAVFTAAIILQFLLQSQAFFYKARFYYVTAVLLRTHRMQSIQVLANGLSRTCCHDRSSIQMSKAEDSTLAFGQEGSEALLQPTLQVICDCSLVSEG